jgi:hypothetical protein
MPTLDHWHEHGGMVARGVLIDFKAWYEQKAIAEGKSGADTVCHPFGGHRITVADIEAVAKHQNVEFRAGDVLIVRTGMTDVLGAPTPEDFEMMQKFQLSGVEGSMAMAKWLWNQHFSAVAGDSIAFEALPPVKENGEPAEMSDLGKFSGEHVGTSSPTLTPASLTSLAALHVWHVHRRTMGPEGAISTLQEDRSLQFLVNINSAPHSWAGGVASQRPSYFLNATILRCITNKIRDDFFHPKI